MKVLLMIVGVLMMALSSLVLLASTMTGHATNESLQILLIGFGMVYASRVLDNLEAIADTNEELLELIERKKNS